MRTSQPEAAELLACCALTREIGNSVEGETVVRLEEDVLKFSGNKRWNTESITNPYFRLFTNKTLPRSLFFRSVPEAMRILRSFNSKDCVALSSGDRSGLIKMPGLLDSLWLCYRASITSQALVKRTSNGRLRLSLYFPSLMQSRIECVLICLDLKSSKFQQLTHDHSTPYFGVQSPAGILSSQRSQH